MFWNITFVNQGDIASAFLLEVLGVDFAETIVEFARKDTLGFTDPNTIYRSVESAESGKQIDETYLWLTQGSLM